MCQPLQEAHMQATTRAEGRMKTQLAGMEARLNQVLLQPVAIHQGPI